MLYLFRTNLTQGDYRLSASTKGLVLLAHICIFNRIQPSLHNQDSCEILKEEL